MNVVVMGAGAVGGYFGGALARADSPVTLIARGKHLEAIASRGLRVRSFRGDFSVSVATTDRPDDVRHPVDLILFCVKSYDTDAGIGAIRGLMDRNPDANVLCLQNGVHNELKLADAFGSARVLSGVAYIGAEVAEPGVIQHDSRGELLIGVLDPGQREAVGKVADQFRSAGVPIEVADDIRAEKWRKFLYNCALNSMTSIAGRRLGVLMRLPDSREVFRQVLKEAESVARAEGIRLPHDVVEQVMNIADQMDIRSSMQVDLERGRPIEVDNFNGYVVQLGRKHRIATPVNYTLYALLKAMTASSHGE